VATTPTLRPLRVGEILEAGIKLYLRHWKPLVLCVAAVVVPVQLLSLALFASIDTTATTKTTARDEVDWPALAALLTLSLAAGLGWVLSTAACLKAVADAWLGATPSARRSLGFALRRTLPLLWLFVVLSFWLVLAFFAFFVPFVWLGVAWALAVPVLLFERVGAWRTLRRFFSLTRGRWWPVFGALVVLFLLRMVVWFVVQAIPSGIAAEVANDSDLATAIAQMAGSAISSLITTPLAAAVITLLYFDMRVRKEGFDLGRLGAGVGSAPDGRDWWKDPAPAGPAIGAEDPLYGDGYASPRAPSEGAPPGSPPNAPGAPKGDRNRAEWLPPEVPRGPEGR
jgi:hypothetical protein